MLAIMIQTEAPGSLAENTYMLPIIKTISPSCTPRQLVRRQRSSHFSVDLRLVVEPASYTLVASLGSNFTANCITVALTRDKTLLIVADRWDLEQDGE